MGKGPRMLLFVQRPNSKEDCRAGAIEGTEWVVMDKHWALRRDSSMMVGKAPDQAPHWGAGGLRTIWNLWLQALTQGWVPSTTANDEL